MPPTQIHRAAVDFDACQFRVKMRSSFDSASRCSFERQNRRLQPANARGDGKKTQQAWTPSPLKRERWTANCL